MCAIIGSLILPSADFATVNDNLNFMFEKSLQRGRDGWGYTVLGNDLMPDGVYTNKNPRRATEWANQMFPKHLTLIANMRAEPTTEFVAQKTDEDQQPYQTGPWAIVHNGTIANDADLRTHVIPTRIDSAAIVELLASFNTNDMELKQLGEFFAEQMQELKGSFAILATHREHPGVIFAACNYRPIWFSYAQRVGLFIASSRRYLPMSTVPQMLPPYGVYMFTVQNAGPVFIDNLRKPANTKALVVCSGGLDSVVAATWAQHVGYEVSLIHFQYGSRAEGPEVHAVQEVAKALDVRS